MDNKKSYNENHNRKSYTKNFKDTIINLVRKHNLAKVSRYSNIPERIIRRWKNNKNT